MRNPLREICTVGSVREENSWKAMVNLNGHETGNGGNSQGEPTASRDLLYSEVHRRDGVTMIAQKDQPPLDWIRILGRTLHPARYRSF